jgi:exodeoxyribonuclease VII large subunit
MTQQKKIYSLSVILKGVKDYLEVRLKNKQFWIKAEISNINFHRSGHCYIDLVETKDSQILAQCKASIWSYNLNNIKLDLGTDFQNILKKGSEVLILVEINFSEIYGLGITVHSVDKSFSFGQLEKRKEETLLRLKNENLLTVNKEKKIPIVIQRIALLGSPNTAGFIDFKKQVKNNEYGFDFEIQEFECQVQGERAEKEILTRLEKINLLIFDVVVIIRGGGSKLDLELFNSYQISKAIASLNLPVFTGIGHETDTSVADVVSNKSFKTPSAVGSHIVEKAYQFYVKVNSNYNYIKEYYEKIMIKSKKDLFANTQYLYEKSISISRLRRGDLHSYSNRLVANIKARLNDEKSILNFSKETILSTKILKLSICNTHLKECKNLLHIRSKQVFKHEQHKNNQNITYLQLLSSSKITNEKLYLESIEKIPLLFHPNNILVKGYAIIRINNIVVKKDTVLKIGDYIEIELIDKIITATVTKSKNKKKWNNLLMNLLQKN